MVSFIWRCYRCARVRPGGVGATGQRFAVMVAMALLVLASTSGRAQAQQDKIRTTQTGWGWVYAASEAAIDAQLGSGSRPFAFQRVDPDQYDTVFVQNAGAYAVAGSDVYYELTESNLSFALAFNGTRVIDLEAYDSGVGVRFNAIVVPNSGSTAAAGWQWSYGLTWSQVLSWLAARPTLRAIDIDYYEVLGVGRYSVVAVPNSGSNFQSATWYATGLNRFEVQDALVANDARLIDIEIVHPGNASTYTQYACIMIPRGSVRSDWFPDVSSGQIPGLLEQVGSRIVCLERFQQGIATRYSVVATDNASAQTKRMRDYILGDDRGFESYSNAVSGTMGFMLKEVGGPVITTINPGFVWEPASTVKLLHAIYALWQCSIWFDALDANVEYRNLNNVSQILSGCTSCAFDWFCGPVNIRLDETIRYLLEPSSNTALIALEKRYGVASINAFADGRGFGSIGVYRQNCACAEVLNTATCTDMCEMMEQAADGSIFATPWREVLFTLMNDLDEQGYELYPTLSNVIDQEAASTSLTAPEIAAFRDAMRFANKGGSYDCGEFWRTEGGWARVPRKEFILGTWLTTAREYVFAIFIDRTGNGNGSNIVYSAKEEILREQIREALATWDDACDTPFILSQPDSITRTEGSNAVFDAVLAGGGDDAQFQWQKRLAGNIWASILNAPGSVSGANTDTLTLIGVGPGAAGEYRLRYTCACGETTSGGAMLTVTPAPSCPGDVNGDGVVNAGDFNILASHFGQPSGATLGEGDLSGDGAVNSADFNVLAANFGGVCP